MAKDKEKVLDEVWTEDRVREFLSVEAKAGTNPDFHKLLKAYQSMRADDFELFIGMFLESGGDINATDKAGRSVLSYAKEHRNSADFVTALEKNGAA
ncbi:PA4642 family protein [Spongiibacter taiwanensis]|uniref:PA4642 family protein n=1 Tax=Spongiibacter taiwanensis TaxID=1748242 RepID=UPI0020364D70|nr:PA4642 family protein [Spongiibacter taiwanensis]USA44327.1 PA4642 family protein [Spongiibacter taiwanensis]